MDKLNRFDDELEAMKDLYISMVKKATINNDIDYDDEDLEEEIDETKNEEE